MKLTARYETIRLLLEDLDDDVSNWTMLFFGSFNPIHNGHMAMARWVVEEGLCEELWFVVSPGNPLKAAAELADAGQRLEMVRLAVAAEGSERSAGGVGGAENGPARVEVEEEAGVGERTGEGRSARQSATRRTLSDTCPCGGVWQRVKVCDVEFRMPRPSYTIDTLERLGSEFPERSFALLIGSDIVGQLDRWKDYMKLLKKYKVFVYPRPGYPVEGPLAEWVTVLKGAPQWDCSSTEVRRAIAEGRGEAMVPHEVLNYIKRNNLWT